MSIQPDTDRRSQTSGQPSLRTLEAGSRCRFCDTELKHVFVDLGMSPLCESYVPSEKLNSMEPFFPLVVYVCEKCFLVQLDEYVAPEEIFTEYAYFSSYADSWVEHARIYADAMIERFGYNSESLVVELASNDGYLLQHFVAKDVPVLGVEPAANVAKTAIGKGIPTEVQFFGVKFAEELAGRGKHADLLLGNNVLAQVPDVNDFVQGMKILLKADGVITMEFPHLMCLIDENQFDTIYHEHFSYFSLYSVERIFEAAGLKMFDVEEIPTHGGSLRIYACHDKADREPSERLVLLRRREEERGFTNLESYAGFSQQVEETKHKLLTFLIEARRQGKRVVGYGAPGKGNTLLNYCGIRTDLLEFTVDRNPYKQGKYLPGTHIPIYAPEKIKDAQPDYVLILPWNFKDEIIKQNSFIRDWGGKFIIPIPEVTEIA